MWPYFCAAGLFERGRPEQAVQEGHAAQNVLLGTEKKYTCFFYFSSFKSKHKKYVLFCVLVISCLV